MERGSTLGSGFLLHMYRVDKYVRVVICLRREYSHQEWKLGSKSSRRGLSWQCSCKYYWSEVTLEEKLFTEGCCLVITHWETGRMLHNWSRINHTSKPAGLHIMFFLSFMICCLVTDCQPRVRKQKPGATYLFLGKSLVTRPCHKKKTRYRGGGWRCPTRMSGIIIHATGLKQKNGYVGPGFETQRHFVH